MVGEFAESVHSVLQPVALPAEEHDLLPQLIRLSLKFVDPVSQSIRRLHGCEQGVGVPARARPPIPRPRTPRDTRPLTGKALRRGPSHVSLAEGAAPLQRNLRKYTLHQTVVTEVARTAVRSTREAEGGVRGWVRRQANRTRQLDIWRKGHGFPEPLGELGWPTKRCML